MMMQFHETIFMQYTKKTFYFNNTGLGSLSESRHISAASTPECKETWNATMGLNGQGPDPKTRSSETSPASPLDYQTTALPKTGQNIKLQTPGTPTRSALGPTLVSSPS
ncbi:hypothetical protein M9H77_10957 [Catharanthus roseus]|uniref:Uncharacterized protein n=1 Tax=Catharanthus roseus TaxID=4058 RepID=A0ACC0BDA4_CATRO|nr:hypothetical protein M9H77_10957 [Catharanthus roseus]